MTDVHPQEILRVGGSPFLGSMIIDVLCSCLLFYKGVLNEQWALLGV